MKLDYSDKIILTVMMVSGTRVIVQEDAIIQRCMRFDLLYSTIKDTISGLVTEGLLREGESLDGSYAYSLTDAGYSAWFNQVQPLFMKAS